MNNNTRMAHGLGYFDVIQNICNYIFRSNIFSFGFIGQSNAVAQHIVANSPYIFGNYKSPVLDKCISFGCLARLMLARGEAP